MKRLFFLTYLFLWGIQLQAQEPLTIAVASSLMPALQEVCDLFAKEVGPSTQLVAGSSGALASQIRGGAPFHLFLSANPQLSEALWKEGRSEKAPAQFAQGQVVFWSKQPIGQESLRGYLQKGGFRSLAIAQPELAPHGAAAKDLLEKMGMYQQIGSQLVFAESTGKINQYIFMGMVDAAFTSNAAQFSPQLKDKGYWLVPEGQPKEGIPHSAILIKVKNQTPHPEAATFFNFLFSPLAQSVFAKYGYLSTDF